jgi:hypothetical protein
VRVVHFVSTHTKKGDTMETISTRIVSLRKDAGLSQQQLADDLNLSRRAVSGRLAGEHLICSPLHFWLTTSIPRWTIWSKGSTVEK